MALVLERDWSLITEGGGGGGGGLGVEKGRGGGGGEAGFTPNKRRGGGCGKPEACVNVNFPCCDCFIL